MGRKRNKPDPVNRQRSDQCPLPLVERLMELVVNHHGYMEVHSRDDEEPTKGTGFTGTEFIVRLPGAEGRESGENPPLSPTETKIESSKPVLLVVDNNDDTRFQIKNLLAPHFQIREAANCREGIRKAKEILQDLAQQKEQQRFFIKGEADPVLHDQRVPDTDAKFLKQVLNVIERNLSKPDFGVEQLARELYMSKSSLYRKIEALTGESPKIFIRSHRLKRAAQLLETHFGNVTEVAFRVGFSSTPYFTKCFKKMFNRLPHTYLVPGRSG